MFVIFFMIVIPLISMFLVNFTVSHYDRKDSSVAGNAYTVARDMLDQNGLNYVKINLINGSLTDNYNDSKKCLNLTEDVAMSRSVSAVAIALHEVGHAIQYNSDYQIMSLRNMLYPISTLGSALGIPMMIVGLVFPIIGVIGTILVISLLLFQILTLPTEFDASRRAVAMMKSEGLLTGHEIFQARKVLNAAAFTYVASMFSLIAMLLFQKK